MNVGSRSKATFYRVTWHTSGQDAALEDGQTVPLRAAVLDTAIEFAKKVSAKWLNTAMVWECGEDGNVVRAFSVDGKLKWPVVCKTCIGRGKVAGYYSGSQSQCDSCRGHGKIPEV